MPPKFESKLSLSRNKNRSGIESPEEPNLEDITTAGSSSEDSSSDDSETEDKTLKQSIRSQLRKKKTLEPLLKTLLDGILSNGEILDLLVDAVYQSFSEKVKEELTQEVYESVSMDISQNKSELANIKEQLKKERDDRIADRKLITKLRQDIRELKEETTDQMDNQEQYSRRNCLLLHGVPESKGEDTTATSIQQLNGKLKCSLTKELIDRSHRLGKPKSGEDAKPRPIIIKFVSYSTRSIIFRSKRKLKASPLLITESLTTRRMELLRKAQAQVRDNKLKGTWTQDGRIYALDNDDHKVLITKAADLV